MALKEEAALELELEGLFCEEESFEDDDFLGIIRVDEERSQIQGQNVIKESSLPFVFDQDDFFWEDRELETLMSKEKETHLGYDDLLLDGYLMVARMEAIDWVLRVKAYYGFTALTGVLAVNYFDRFISSFRFQKDKPWMGQLAAVACLSLAAKVEETNVPLLLDLQVEESKYVFEAKTIKRMELLVLSSLQWRMNPVTPISFFDHMIRRLGLMTNLHWEFLRKCELLLLSVISDSRVMSYLPSVLATAIMLYVIKEVGSSNQVECVKNLITVLNKSEDEVNECCKIIVAQSVNQCQGQKRKNPSTPSSPNGVIDAFYSSDSSNDSWAVASTISSSPTMQFKRGRAQISG